MPDSREFDVRWLSNLEIPYDLEAKDLSDKPRIVEGSDMFVTRGGKLKIAPGLNTTGYTTATYTTTDRIDRLVIYETLDNPAVVFLLASVSVAGSYEVRYMRLDAGAPAWTTITNIRDVNDSLYPHEFLVAHGKVYIKYFPASGKFGTVIFEGTAGTVSIRGWGIDGPNGTTSYLGMFGSSAASYTLLFGFRYAYAYVSLSGQVSSRSLVSGASGFTGPQAATTSTPRIQGVYSTDTEIDGIIIYRTTDGGGTFYYLDQIANNTAGGNWTYDDDNSPSAPGDPTHDDELDTTSYAPSDISNHYPPSQVDQADIGSAPQRSSNLAYFARRIWYGLGNRLYFSGQEEILTGNPEESFYGPYAIRGNYYVVKGQIRYLQATKRMLIVGTSEGIMYVFGQDRTNLLIDDLAPNIKAIAGHPHAITAFGEYVYLVAVDFSIWRITPTGTVERISDPLSTYFTSIVSTIGATSDIELTVYSQDANTWLIVNVTDHASTASYAPIQFVYDIERGFWFTPWTRNMTAMAVGRLRESDTKNYLVGIHFTGVDSIIGVLDATYRKNHTTTFEPYFATNLFTPPAGNHINALRAPAHVSILAYAIVERTKNSGDTEPTVVINLDDLSTNSYTPTASDPPYLAQHTDFSEKWYPVYVACKRVRINMTGTAGEDFDIQNLGFVFHPEAGA